MPENSIETVALDRDRVTRLFVDELVVDANDVFFRYVLAENDEILERPVTRPADLLRSSRVLRLI